MKRLANRPDLATLVKANFQNLPIQCWQVEAGKLGTAKVCLCMKAAAEPIGTLLLAVDEVIAEGAPSKRSLTLLPNKRKKQCSTVRIRYLSPSEELREMSIRREKDVAILEFTATGLAAFRVALTAWQNGSEDFGIHPSGRKHELGAKDRTSGELWFWTPFMDP